MTAERDRDQDLVFSFAKKVLRHSTVYGAFDFLGRAGLFLLVPLYARALTPAEYGILEIFTVTQAVLLVLVVAGFNSALVRWCATARSEEERGALFGTALTTVVLVAGGVCALLAASAGPLNRLVLGTPDTKSLWYLLLAIVLLDAVTQLFLALFRARSLAVRYSTVNLTRLLVSLGVNVILVGVLHRGVGGALAGNLLGVGIALVLAVSMALGDLRWGVSREALGRLAGFGLPLVVSGVAFFAMNSADRYILKMFVPLEDLGIYALGYKVGLVMSIVVNALVVAWPPLIFQVSEDRNAPAIFGRIVTYFSLLGCGITLLLGSLNHEIVHLLGGETYARAAGLVPPVLAAYVFSGVYYILTASAGITDRTRWLPVVVGAGAALNIAGNLALIPRLGILGAAVSTLGSFAAMAFLMGWVGRRLYPIRIEWRRLLLLALLTGGALALNLAGIGHGDPADPWLKLAVTAAMVPALFLTGFFSAEERLRARLLLRRRLGGRREASAPDGEER